MKLKEAVEVAKRIEFCTHVAANKDMIICGYAKAPGEGCDAWNHRGVFFRIGLYTGSKHWTKTLRKVK